MNKHFIAKKTDDGQIISTSLRLIKPDSQRAKKSKKGVGRPSVITAAVLQQLTFAYKLGCTDEEACFLPVLVFARFIIIKG